MTTTTVRARPGRTAVIDDRHTLYIAHLGGSLRSHVHGAEKADAAYVAQQRLLRRKYPDEAAYLTRLADDLELASAASALAHHQRMAALYADALAGEVAARTLLTGEVGP